VTVFAEQRNPYSVNLGTLTPGQHSVDIRFPAELAGSAKAPHIAAIEHVALSGVDALLAQHAPLLEGRDLGLPGGRAEATKTDAPLLLTGRVLGNDDGSQTLQYRALFSGEDGGTPAKALLASNGRTSDYEPVYEVRINPDGTRGDARYQGVRHTYHPFTGTYSNEQPKLRTASSPNNFSQRLRGSGTVWAPLPIVDEDATPSFDLMRKHPWTFAVAGKELNREHPELDPRTFLYVRRAEASVADTVTVRTRDGASHSLPLPATAGVDDASAVRLPASVEASSIVAVEAGPGARVWRMNERFALDALESSSA
jgi:hypothetical protein